MIVENSVVMISGMCVCEVVVLCKLLSKCSSKLFVLYVMINGSNVGNNVCVSVLIR